MNERPSPSGVGAAPGDVPGDADLAERCRLLETELAELTLAYESLEVDNQRLGAERQRLAALLERCRNERAATAAEPGDSGSAPLPPFPDEPISPSRAIELCRRQLPRVALPESACREIDRLDQARASAVWGRRLLEGFYAFEAYARRAASFQGGFFEWCKSSGHPHAWPATRKKIAMSEGQTVRTGGKTASTRTLPIDKRVRASGQIPMVAHLKIAEGGGDNIPRVYFHDDTGGTSGQIHVGFVGPHKLMPNTRS